MPPSSKQNIRPGGGPAAQARHRTRVLRIEPAKLPAVSPLRALVAWPFRFARAAKSTRRRLRSAVPAATPRGRPSGKPQGLPSLRLSVVSARGALAGPSGLFTFLGKRNVALRESLRLLPSAARADGFSAPPRRLCASGWQTTPAGRAIRRGPPKKAVLKSPLAAAVPSHPDHSNPRFASGERRGRGEAEPSLRRAGRGPAPAGTAGVREAGSHALRAVPGTE